MKDNIKEGKRKNSKLFYVLLSIGVFLSILLLAERATAAPVCCMIQYSTGSGWDTNPYYPYNQIAVGPDIYTYYLLVNDEPGVPADVLCMDMSLDRFRSHLSSCYYYPPCYSTTGYSACSIYPVHGFETYYTVTGRCNQTCGVCNDANMLNCNNDPSDGEYGDGCETDPSTDIFNCGSCGNACASYGCEDGRCLECDDGRITPALREVCDGDNFDGKTCGSYDSPLGKPFTTGKLSCVNDCKTIDTSNCGNCGDGIKAGSEICDNGTIGIEANGNICTPTYSSTGTPNTCAYCTSTCTSQTVTGAYCGDKICQAGIETEASCFNDCVKGWTVVSGNWNLTPRGVLNTSTTGSMYSDGVILKVGKSYTLSASVSRATAGCFMNLTINNTCKDPEDFVDVPCGISVASIPFDVPADGIWTSRSVVFTTPTVTTYAVNGEYFDNVRIVLNATCSNPGNISIKDISLKEDKDVGVNYNLPLPPLIQASSCCLDSYCWNGEYCVNSALWMDDAFYPPLWNDVITRTNDDGHVMSSIAGTTTGYRCINNGAGSANWARAYIKYDWDYNTSGYCANITDCLVNQKDLFGGSSAGCAPNGSIVNDKFIPGTSRTGGNHYCHDGNWTTKSYIVATLLQTITTPPYRLQCYDDASLVYNFVDELPSENVVSSCIISRPESIKDSKIIAGLVLRGSDEEDYLEAARGFMSSAITTYNSQLPDADALPSDPEDCLSAEPVPVAVGSDFSRCVGVGNTGLHIYYNFVYDYFIIANHRVTAIEAPVGLAGIWLDLKRSFTRLFVPERFNPSIYSAINHATSYDRIYVVKNNSVNVVALEESKYDELEEDIVTIMYIRYEGTNSANNPIVRNDVFHSANRYVLDNDPDLILAVEYPDTVGAQDLIIKTKERTGLWRYFTSSLRMN